MKYLTTEEVEKRIFNAGRLVLPDLIREAIIGCLQSSPEEIERGKNTLHEAYKNYNNIPEVKFDVVENIDAYTLEYLPRNFFIPQIGLRDLAFNVNTVQFGETIRILDLGSGTGAVSLGIFEFFSKEPFDGYSIDLLALDNEIRPLQRQKRILNKSKLQYDEDTFTSDKVDLSDIDVVEEYLSKFKPWDLIFSANFMNELLPNDQYKLVNILEKYLSTNGSIILSEPAQDRGKKLMLNVFKSASDSGMTIYYPCSGDSECICCDPEILKSNLNKCWKWREYQLSNIEPFEIDGEQIGFCSTPLKISTLILNKNGSTIFDRFRKDKPELKWGVIAPRGYGAVNWHKICSLEFDMGYGKQYKRGSIVGWDESEGKVRIVKNRNCRGL